MWGPIVPELADVLRAVPIIERTTVNTWDDKRVVDAVKAAGRKKLIVTGISTDVCLALPAIAALADGFQSYAVVDAFGGFSQTRVDMGVSRMQQAGVVAVGYSTVAVELLADNAEPEAEAVYAALACRSARWSLVLSNIFRKRQSIPGKRWVREVPADWMAQANRDQPPSEPAPNAPDCGHLDGHPSLMICYAPSTPYSVCCFPTRCFLCLGAYTGAVPDAQLRTITVDDAIEFARVLRGSSPEAYIPEWSPKADVLELVPEQNLLQLAVPDDRYGPNDHPGLLEFPSVCPELSRTLKRGEDECRCSSRTPGLVSRRSDRAYLRAVLELDSAL